MSVLHQQLGARSALSGPFSAFNATTTRRPSRAAAPARALFTKKKSTDSEPATKSSKADLYEKKKGVFGRTMSAFDFAEARSKSDRELLYEAKYGKLMGQDGKKMSREQYAALRRKVGGTKKDFFKTSIEAKGEYVDKGYVGKTSVSTSVPGLPFLALTVVLLFGTLGYVVVATQ